MSKINNNYYFKRQRTDLVIKEKNSDGSVTCITINKYGGQVFVSGGSKLLINGNKVAECATMISAQNLSSYWGIAWKIGVM